MPLGDSITLGALSGTESGNGGYRAGLWSSLTSGNYPVNFVGSLSYGPVGMDPDHEGHGGWRTDEISANIVTWLNMTLPDVVLLHIGTNDIIQGSSTSLVSSRIATLVDQIVANRPDTRILVASVIPVRIPNDFGVTNQSIDSLNVEIQSLVSTRAAQGKNVTFVNMNGLAGLTSTDFGPDGLHPAGSGYSKMAAVWFTALTPFLN
jgi:lysophospholipase L1-like esterase